MPRKALIIAEIGENHLGDWDLARRMVVEAAKAGADVVKFQSYLGSEVSADDPERDWFIKVHLPDEMHFELKDLAEKNGVQFMTAPFTLERARFVVEELGLRSIKIASSEMLNFPLLDYVDGRADSVVLSTGMSTIEQIQTAVSHLGKVKDLCILHCTTEYPCPDEHASVAAVTAIKNAFPQHRVGLSDHTIGIVAPAVAVALGADVVEKHFTLDKSLPGTDHVLSVTPSELAEMVKLIRTVECLLGDGTKRPSRPEAEIESFVRSRFPKEAH